MLCPPTWTVTSCSERSFQWFATTTPASRFTSDPTRESPTKLRCAMLEESSTIVDLSSQPGPIVTPRPRNTPPRRYAVPATKHAAEIMAGGLIIAPGSIVASLWTETLGDLRKGEDSREEEKRSS